MTTQHADIFHCLKCGRLNYQPHGEAAPACCGETMVRAVADVVSDISLREREELLANRPLFAEAVEIAHWSRTFPDIDVTRYDQLSQRLRALHTALADRFESTEVRSDGGQERLLTAIHSLIAEMRAPESLGGWARVCERLDAIVDDFRRVETGNARTSRTV